MPPKARSSAPTTRRLPPGPAPSFFFGNARELQRHGGHQFVLEQMRRYGDIFQYRILKWTVCMLCHPDDIKYFLQDNNRNYNKDAFAYRTLRLILGNGLLTSDGDFWRRQRRLAQPAFHRRRIAGFGTLMTGAAQEMLTRWEGYARHEATFDLAKEMMQLTLQIVGQALFNIDLTDEADEVGQAVALGLTETTARFSRPFALPLFIPTPQNRRFRAARRTLDDVVYTIINERRGDDEDRGDLLSMFMLAQDEETGAQMNDEQLRDEVMTMMLAGHETTANALTWTWYLLAQHPEVEAKLEAELAAVLNGRIPTIDDLSNLPYTKMVVQEAIRLYPPAWIFSRCAIGDDEIGGYRVPAGTVVSVSPYAVHRNPHFWRDPEIFSPERFTPEKVAARHRFAYIPFAAGPRKCIGDTFALTEAQLILATVAQRYRVRLIPDQAIVPETTITLRPRHGIQIRLQAVS